MVVDASVRAGPRRTSLFSCVCFATALFASQPARAQAQPDANRTTPTSSDAEPPEQSEARAAFLRGVTRSSEERWGEALVEFRRAFALVPRPSAAFNVAITLVRLGRHVEAFDALEAYLRIAEGPEESARIAEARRQLESEGRAFATITLRVSPSDARVRVEGRPDARTGATRGLRLDPGTYTLEVSAPGHRPASATWTLRAGESRVESLTLQRITTSTLEVVPSVRDASVRVDGVSYAPGPREVAAGPHEIRVEREGYEPFRRRIVLAPESSLRVDASLSRRSGSFISSPLFWALAGVGVAGVATAVGVAAALTGGPPEFQTSTGIVIQGLSR
jgi:hypothetical protein